MIDFWRACAVSKLVPNGFSMTTRRQALVSSVKPTLASKSTIDAKSDGLTDKKKAKFCGKVDASESLSLRRLKAFSSSGGFA